MTYPIAEDRVAGMRNIHRGERSKMITSLPPKLHCKGRMHETARTNCAFLASVRLVVLELSVEGLSERTRSIRQLCA